MIPNCRRCEEDYNFMIKNLQETEDLGSQQLHFAGSGLFEKKHLDLILVNNNGVVVVS